jgi:hypothetical protein
VAAAKLPKIRPAGSATSNPDSLSKLDSMRIPRPVPTGFGEPMAAKTVLPAKPVDRFSWQLYGANDFDYSLADAHGFP